MNRISTKKAGREAERHVTEVEIDRLYILPVRPQPTDIVPTSDRVLRYNLNVYAVVVVPCHYLHFYFVDYHANFNSTGNKALRLPLRSMRGLSRLSLICRVSHGQTYTAASISTIPCITPIGPAALGRVMVLALRVRVLGLT